MDLVEWECGCLGGAFAPAAEHAPGLAGLHYADDTVGQARLREAQRLTPKHIAVQMGWYRYYFYQGWLPQALTELDACIRRAAEQFGLRHDWRLVEGNAADFGNYDAVAARFYLFALPASPCLHSRPMPAWPCNGDRSIGRRHW